MAGEIQRTGTTNRPRVLYLSHAPEDIMMLSAAWQETKLIWF